MRKNHEFRPAIDGAVLEERIVLSTIRPVAIRQAAIVQTQPTSNISVLTSNHNRTYNGWYYHTYKSPFTTTKRQVDRTINDVHNAMVRFQQSMNHATRAAIRALDNGADPTVVFDNLAARLDTQTTILSNRILHASGRLPYGAGFSIRPSGGPSLNSQISPSVAGTPAADLVDEMAAAIAAQDIDTLADLTTGVTLRQVYSPTRIAIVNYVHDGVISGDFNYKA
jgi:hypothetical protein